METVKENKKTIKKHSFTDANGTQYILNAETREIISTMDRSGFIYDSTGKRVGNIHNRAFMEGFNY